MPLNEQAASPADGEDCQPNLGSVYMIHLLPFEIRLKVLWGVRKEVQEREELTWCEVLHAPWGHACKTGPLIS